MEAVSYATRTRQMVWTALLSALAALLMYLDMAVPLFPSFLKMDLSDVPALIGAFIWGPGAGILIEAIKNGINTFTTTSAGIGQVANFIMGSALVLPAGFVYRRWHTKKGAVAGLILGTLSMAVIAAVANTWFLLPFYSRFIPLDKIVAMSHAVIPAITDLRSLVLYGVVPFNIFKGIIVSLATFALYKRISVLLSR
ncbi:MAG: ECF transporter S component [Dethiosulfovibrio peptidovorans]|nr:MAG: ECF transporter S component [Dethiosulfovibrio peptidovorans]